MARGIRKAPPQALPQGVKWATQVPILIIPSGGHSAKMDGSDGALRNRSTNANERDVKVRYPPCCDEHKKQLKLESLVTEGELASLATRFQQHIGHGRLIPERAKVEWAPCTEKMPCEDCMSEYQDKQVA